MILELQREILAEIKFNECVVGMYLVLKVLKHPTFTKRMKMDKNEKRPRTEAMKCKKKSRSLKTRLRRK